MAFTEVRPIADALRNEDTFTTTLLLIVIEQYGVACLKWSPETILLELQDDFGVTLGQQNRDQLIVGLNLLTSDDFYRRLPYFIQTCNVLSGSELSVDFDRADTAECAWGITEARLIWPPEEEEDVFSPEITHYLRHVMKEDGITQPPKILQAAVGNMEFGGFSSYAEVAPAVLSQIRKAHTEKTQEIEQMLQSNLSQLLSQLAAVPGKKSSVDRLVADMRRAS